MPNRAHVDYSQWRNWMDCPARWYELAVNRRRKSWPEGPREDALAVGSLVHAGIERWLKVGEVGIPEAKVQEINPTRDCLEACEAMVYGYVKTYPQERWELIKCEEPLRFPLIDTLVERWNVDGLAKVDAYFWVPELTTIPSGLEGYELTLDRGWWGMEHKTKAPELPPGVWMSKWEVAAQASFQMLALRAKVERDGLGGVGR